MFTDVTNEDRILYLIVLVETFSKECRLFVITVTYVFAVCGNLSSNASASCELVCLYSVQ